MNAHELPGKNRYSRLIEKFAEKLIVVIEDMAHAGELEGVRHEHDVPRFVINLTGSERFASQLGEAILRKLTLPEVV